MMVHLPTAKQLASAGRVYNTCWRALWEDARFFNRHQELTPSAHVFGITSAG